MDKCRIEFFREFFKGITSIANGLEVKSLIPKGIEMTPDTDPGYSQFQSELGAGYKGVRGVEELGKEGDIEGRIMFFGFNRWHA